MKIFLEPHNDDSALFGAFTILREKPIIVCVTDGAKHEQRGIVKAVDRRKESIEAAKILGVKVEFLGIPDDNLTQVGLICALQKKYPNPDKVFAPAPYENGNPDHNLVGRVAQQLYKDRVTFYSTYRLNDLRPQGNVIIFPTEKEIDLKCAALWKYESQLRCNKIHFDAVIGHPEYYVA